MPSEVNRKVSSGNGNGADDEGVDVQTFETEEPIVTLQSGLPSTTATLAYDDDEKRRDSISKEEREATDGDHAEKGKGKLSVEGMQAQAEEEEEIEVPLTPTAFTLIITCALGMTLNTSSISSMSIALPWVGKDFDESEDQLQWLVSAFSLSSGCLLLFFGRLADLYGRKHVFLLSNVWFAIFSIACGFGKNITALYILRGLQGIGSAALIPAALGILAHTFPPSRTRSIAFATFSAGAPVGGAIGIVIGGVLTQTTRATWRSPFFLSAGLAALVFLGGFLTIAEDKQDWGVERFVKRVIRREVEEVKEKEVVIMGEEEEDRRVDWIGAVLVTAGLVCIMFVLGQGELAPDGWKTDYIIALLIIGVLCLAGFFGWEWYLESAPPIIDANGRKLKSKRTPPLMSLSLWTRARGKFAVMQGIAFLEWCSFVSWQFWAQLFYQNYQGYTPILTAVRLIPMSVTGVLCNLVVALVIGRIDVVYLIVIGTLTTGVAGLLFAVINPAAVYWAFGFPAAITVVFGADFVFACGTLFVAKVSLPGEQSLAGGVFQTLTQLGTAFGLAMTTIVHNRVLQHRSDDLGAHVDQLGTGAPRAAQLDAYQAAQWTAFAFAVLGAVLGGVFLRGVGVVGHRQTRKKKGMGTA